MAPCPPPFVRPRGMPSRLVHRTQDREVCLLRSIPAVLFSNLAVVTEVADPLDFSTGAETDFLN